MRTVTHSIVPVFDREFTGFNVCEIETLHVVTGDESSHYFWPTWYWSWEDAQKDIDETLKEMV
jgi:hypothetical protein